MEYYKMSRCLSQMPYKLGKKNIVNVEHRYPNLVEKKDTSATLCSEFTHSTTSNKITPLDNNNNNIDKNNNSIITRTMSPGKWVKQDGLDTHVYGEEETYHTNEEMKDNKENLGGGAFEDIWKSILSEKKSERPGSDDPAPYVHLLVKRTSSLSEKSLEICTESLGSETGSDGFSNPSPDNEEEQEREQESGIKDYNKVGYGYYPIINNKKVYNNVNVGVVKSFPPPLSCLSYSDEVSNFHMRTRREDGRLVVDAVSVACPKLFTARREEGRLLLTVDNVEFEKAEDGDCEVDFVGVEENNNLGMMNVNVNVSQSSIMVMNKPMKALHNRNGSNWPRPSNMTIVGSVELETARQLKISFPPRSGMSTATSADVLNVYEYYWRQNNNTSDVAVITPLVEKQNHFIDGSVSSQVVKDEKEKRVNKFILEHNRKEGIKEEEVEEYIIPYLKGRGCVEHKRSHLYGKPYCIPTS